MNKLINTIKPKKCRVCNKIYFKSELKPFCSFDCMHEHNLINAILIIRAYNKKQK